MKLLVFDTETTALRPGQICQLAAVVEDDGKLTAINRFYAVDEMSETSFAVHGLSIEKLQALSCGRTFTEDAAELLELFSTADVIAGHNVAADLRFLSTEFERAGMKMPEIKHFCTMNHFTRIMMLERRWPTGYPKPPKLSELMTFLDISTDEVQSLCMELFTSDGSLHDARFDAALTYLCIVKGRQAGYITDI